MMESNRFTVNQPLEKCYTQVSHLHINTVVHILLPIMLYPCMFCVSLLMDLFVVCVACLTVFVNCLMKPFAKCMGVFAILFNVMDLFSVNGGTLLDRHAVQQTVIKIG